MGLFSSLISIFDRSGRISHYFARYWSRFIFAGVGIRTIVNGVENIPKDRAVIFAANHQSTMDIPAMFGYLPVQFRIMAKQILFMVPFLGWHLYMSGNIPINRKDARQAFGSVFKASNLLKQGISLLVFLEGTRSRDGKLHRFKRGGFTLARKLNVPLVPVAIKGSHALMPSGAWTAKGGIIEIDIMPAIEISADDETSLIAQDVRRQMINAGLEDSDPRTAKDLD